MVWVIAFHELAEAELLAQPTDIQARLERIKVLVESFGLERLPAKYASHITGALWEFRLKGKDGIARALYVTRSGKRIIIVRVFAKKTQKTPRREIEMALARAKEVT
jgi:phage-related protein